VLEVDVFDAKPQAFHQAKPPAVQKAADEPIHAPELGQHALHFLHAQHCRVAHLRFRAHDFLKPRQLDAEHAAIQKQQCTQRLVLRAGRYPGLDGKLAQKPAHVARPKLKRRIQCMYARSVR
jgi:uncharacterized protein involved in type VI secretion and phage assembly